MADPLRLYGLKALITHAAGGIGEASARTLVKHGASVLAVDTANSGVEQHFNSVKGIDGHSAVLNDAARMPALVEEAVKHLGGIDILINDFPPQPDVPLSDGDEEANVLIESRSALVMSICRAALPHLKKSPAGELSTLGSCVACSLRRALVRLQLLNKTWPPQQKRLLRKPVVSGSLSTMCSLARS